MNTWKWIVLALALTAVVAAGALGGKWFNDNKRPNFNRNVELYVTPGMSVNDILSQIPDSVLARRRSLDRTLRKHGRLDNGIDRAVFLNLGAGQFALPGTFETEGVVAAGNARDKGIHYRVKGLFCENHQSIFEHNQGCYRLNKFLQYQFVH